MLDLGGAGDGRICPACHIRDIQAGSLLLHWQCIQDKWLIQCPFGKLEQQCSWSSITQLHFGTSCLVVVDIKILKWTCSPSWTETTRLIILHLVTVWSDPSGHSHNQREGGCIGNSTMPLLLCGTCWEKYAAWWIAAHTAPPAASEIELMYCTSSDFQSSENIHGFHQI